MTAQDQAFNIGRAWEAAPEPKRQFVLQIVRPDLKVETFRIGPHAPTMKSEDVHLVHRLWLNITREHGMDRIHHSDVVTLALTRFARDYAGHDRPEILRELKRLDGKTPLPRLNEPPDLAAGPPPPGEDGSGERHERPPGTDTPLQ
jgi:hypothetical protein